MAKEERITTPVGRLSYPSLDKPRAALGSTEEKFTATLIFDVSEQKTPAYRALVAAANKAAADKFGAAEVARLKELQVKLPQKKIWSPAFHLGSEKVDSEGKVEAAYAGGAVYIAPSTKFPPDLFAPSAEDPRKAVKTQASTLYAGCYARGRVVAFAWEHETGGKGVSFGLRGVQFVRDGEKLSGGGVSEDEWDAAPGAQAPQPASYPADGGGSLASRAGPDEELPF